MDRFGSNSGYVDALYEQFISDPDSVSAAWREFFDGYQPEQDSRQKSDPEEGGPPTREDVLDPPAASLASAPPPMLQWMSHPSLLRPSPSLVIPKGRQSAKRKTLPK